jgi:hypothetical protein
MRGGGPLLSPLQSQLAASHAGDQFGRQLKFEQLGTHKRASEMRAKWADKIHGMNMAKLKDEKKMLGLQTWLGLGGAGLSYMEGERRRGIMEQDRLATEKLRQSLLADQEGYRTYNQAYGMGLLGGL